MNLTDGDCLIGEVEVVVAGPSCDRSRQVTDVCSGTESSVSPNNDMSEKHRATIKITYKYRWKIKKK